ncbi:MAG TPA: hypothetical protein VM491_12350, partial [Burkholderiaceae bacterium]|nr:hypothetical protein [Burkholderiaceae bacterium]
MPAPAPAPVGTLPEGFWEGSTNTGRSLFSLVQDNGVYWMFYTGVNQPDSLSGVIHGSMTSTGTTFSSNNARDFNLEGPSVLNATISGNYAFRSTFGGTVTYPILNQSGTFTSTYDADYELTPNLSAVAGTFSGESAGAEGPATVAVTAAGAVSGSSGPCSYSGTMAPRPRGNVYNLSVTFAGANCVLAPQTFSGAAVYNAQDRALLAVGLDPGRLNGFIFLG